ncbi:lipoprotein [Listeria grandensis FSL F6-0971]|uniref:Lipoprotein n=1 Tax=Listeria grandensis FSL F6-0971 TaxID=1265819 RepID=W7BSA1_9LIST|nr:DUF4352 domain-containing protein [Listeria grandensis]EUJ23148.1 lipoprotein [Listeria grandensis FSL F6-0971]
MKKVIIFALAAVLLAGCSNTASGDKNEVKTEQKAVKRELNKAKTVNEIVMKITNATTIKDDTLEQGQEMLQLKFEIKNGSKAEYGIGSGDFYIQDEAGKKYTMTGREDNFGAAIKAGATLKGNGYYAVPKNAKKLTVVYDQVMNKAKDKKTISWFIGTPTK